MGVSRPFNSSLPRGGGKIVSHPLLEVIAFLEKLAISQRLPHSGRRLDGRSTEEGARRGRPVESALGEGHIEAI